MNNKDIRHPFEVRERAVRMVLEHQHEYGSRLAAIEAVAGSIGCPAEMLRRWLQELEERRARTSVGDLVDEIARLFEKSEIYYGHGTDNALDEAAYLVLAALDLPFDLTEEQMNSPVSGGDVDRIGALARRRIEERVPVAYLVRQGWFAGLPFYVDERVLVPRSPLAELIETGFEPWIDQGTVRDILDIGTGSGCIAVAAALSLPDAAVDAVDLDPGALAVAAVNVGRYGLEDRVKLIGSDLYEGLSGKQYDLIIANPPYVDAADMAALPAEFLHEPRSGLAAGDDGLDIVRRILFESGAHIREGGVLVVEVGNSRTALERSFPGLPFTWLEFERGGEGVFLLPAEALKK